MQWFPLTFVINNFLYNRMEMLCQASPKIVSSRWRHQSARNEWNIIFFFMTALLLGGILFGAESVIHNSRKKYLVDFI